MWQETNRAITASPTSLTPLDPAPPMRSRPRSLALGPLPPPQLQSPVSPTSSSSSAGRLSPLFSVVKRASRVRPANTRTKSTNDAPMPPMPPLVSPVTEQPLRRLPTRSRSALPVGFEIPPGLSADSSASSVKRSDSVSIAETTTSKRAPRKLRKSQPPPVPTIRTDDLHIIGDRGRDFSLSPVTSAKRKSWRQSLPIFGSNSAPSSPMLDVEQSYASRGVRTPSPVGAFPSAARREGALPSVESGRRKRGSSSSSGDSYLGDGEQSTRPSLTRSHTDNQAETERRRRETIGSAHSTASSSSLHLDRIEEQAEEASHSTRTSLHAVTVGSRTRTPSSNTTATQTMPTHSRVPSHSASNVATVAEPTSIHDVSYATPLLASKALPSTSNDSPSTTSEATPELVRSRPMRASHSDLSASAADKDGRLSRMPSESDMSVRSSTTYSSALWELPDSQQGQSHGSETPASSDVMTDGNDSDGYFALARRVGKDVQAMKVQVEGAEPVVGW